MCYDFGKLHYPKIINKPEIEDNGQVWISWHGNASSTKTPNKLLLVTSHCMLSLICSERGTRSLVKQELHTLPEHPSSPPVFSGVRVTRSLVLYVCFVDRCLSFCTFSFGHYVVCSSSIYGFWLPLWYLQTLLRTSKYRSKTQH